MNNRKRQRNPERLRLPSLADEILTLCESREREPRQDLKRKIGLKITALQQEHDRRHRLFIIEDKTAGR